MAISMERLSELCAVSGDEAAAREYLIPKIQELADSVTVDTIGNIIAYKKGASDEHRVLLGTNIDEVGFIVSEITDTGFVKFKSVGTIDARTLVSKNVVIGTARVGGVIGMKAIHLQKSEEREAAVKVRDLYIDIGAKDKASAEALVSLGDYIAFDTKFADLGDIIKGKALDRFGTLALLAAMQETPPFDTYFVFSTQREIPCSVMGRGMRVAAYAIAPDFALIVDTVDAKDVPKTDGAAVLGGGAVIEYMDRTSIADTVFTAEIADLASRKEIKTQPKTSASGASIAGAVQAAGGGAHVATVGIPARYSHTGVVMMHKSDIDAVSALCRAFIKESDVIINGFIKKTDRA